MRRFFYGRFLNIETYQANIIFYHIHLKMSQKKICLLFSGRGKINNPNQEECPFFNSSRISISRTSVEEGGAGAAASSGAVRVSLLAPLISQNNTIAIHRNEIVADRKLPYFTPFQLRSAILSAFTALK